MFGKKGTSTRELVHGGAPAPDIREKKKEEKAKRSEHRSVICFLQSKVFWGVLCLIAAAMIAFVATPMVQKQAATLKPVVILTQDVPTGTLLTGDMLRVENIGAAGVPQGAISEVGEVTGQYISTMGLTGDVLTAARLTSQYPTDDPELLSLPEGKVAMAVALDSLETSVASKLRAGDIIQLYAVLNDTQGLGANDTAIAAVIVPELQAVEVLGVTNAKADDVTDKDPGLSQSADEDRQIATVVLAVDENQAAMLAGLSANARLHAALVVRGNAAAKAAVLAAQEEYFLTVTEPTPLPDAPDQLSDAPEPGESEAPEPTAGGGGER